MQFKDYYQVLGVQKNASIEDIKKSYRKLARKYHPDVSKEADAQARMQEVNEAYTVLSDPEKRAAYDQVGAGHRPGEEFRPPPNWDAGFEFSGSGMGSGAFGGGQADFSDFFSSLFGQAARGRRREPRMRGSDHHARIVIDLADAYQGAVRTVTLRGAHLDDTGRVASTDRVLKVQIPKGVREGQHIRLAGQGSPGIGGEAAGDLYLEVAFAPDNRYRVEDSDVYQRLRVAPWEAALGAVVEVATPSGTVQVKVPAGSQAGRKLRLKGRGIPARTPGDLYLELDVVLPPADSPAARQVYETMARELAFDPRRGGTP